MYKKKFVSNFSLVKVEIQLRTSISVFAIVIMYFSNLSSAKNWINFFLFLPFNKANKNIFIGKQIKVFILLLKKRAAKFLGLIISIFIIILEFLIQNLNF